MTAAMTNQFLTDLRALGIVYVMCTRKTDTAVLDVQKMTGAEFEAELMPMVEKMKRGM